MSDRPITLDFLAEQQAAILAAIRAIRDDLLVATAALTRLDGSVSELVRALGEKPQ